MKKALLILLILGYSVASKAISCTDTIKPLNAYVYLGGQTTLRTNDGGGTWSSSNKSIASISSAGAVRGVSAGSCTISYHAGGCTYTKTIQVHRSAPTILNIGTSGYVTIDGQNYARGSLLSKYSVSGPDTLLGVLYSAPAQSPFVVSKVAGAYLDSDNDTASFTSMAELRHWMNSHFEATGVDSGSTPPIPLGEIAYGTGTGTTSNPNYNYDPINGFNVQGNGSANTGILKVDFASTKPVCFFSDDDRNYFLANAKDSRYGLGDGLFGSPALLNGSKIEIDDPNKTTSITNAIAFTGDQIYDHSGDVAISDGVRTLYYDPPSVVAAATIELPLNPQPGYEGQIIFGGTIGDRDPVVTTLTITVDGVFFLVGHIVNLVHAGDRIFIKYRADTMTYYISISNG